MPQFLAQPCFENERQMFGMPGEKSLGSSTVAQLLLDGLEVSYFFQLAFLQMVPGYERNDFNPRVLVAGRNGRVVGRNILWTESLRQSEALSLRVQAGQIRSDGLPYNEILQSVLPEDKVYVNRQGVEAFQLKKGFIIPDIQWYYPKDPGSYSFDTSASAYVSRIEIRHCILHSHDTPKKKDRQSIDWIQAINVLATATHMNDFTPSQTWAEELDEDELNRRMRRRLVRDGVSVYWSGIYFSRMDRKPDKLMVRTGADKMLKIFAISQLGEFRRCGVHIIRQGTYPLLHCIEEAESRSNELSSWVIFD